MRILAAALSVLAFSLVTMTAQALDLNILHINDHHSHLRADAGMDLTLGGKKTRTTVGGFPRVVAAIKRLSAGRDNVLKLHAGDAITGDLYYTLFKGEADAALMNHVCFDAFALGNHEFDDGDAGLKTFLDHLKSGDRDTPVLAANAVPEVSVSPLTKKTATDYLRPYTVTTRRGIKIGIVGIDIAKKTKGSSNPDDSTVFLDERQTSQRMINELTAQSVKHIVLLTHYQYRNDLALARSLRGADVIVGGDSHTLLGDFGDLGLNSEGPYPTVVEDLDGNSVCVVQAWQYAAVVGELDVTFADDGTVTASSGTPHLLLSDSFKRKDAAGKRVALEGEGLKAVMADVAAKPQLSIVAEDVAAVGSLFAAFEDRQYVLQASYCGEHYNRAPRLPGLVCFQSWPCKNV